MSKSTLFALASGAAAVLVAGRGGTSGSGEYGSATPSKAASSAPTVALTSYKLDKVLTDSAGRTLYIFVADKSTKSTCYGACASLWPPLTVSGALRRARA